MFKNEFGNPNIGEKHTCDNCIKDPCVFRDKQPFCVMTQI